jgi:uncharacterized membrane protein
MSKSQIETELLSVEDKLRKRYSLISKLMIIIAIVLTILIIIIFLGINSLGYGYNWAGADLNTWIIMVSVIFALFIILELIFFFHFSTARTKRVEVQKPKKEYINGKRIFIYTFPKGKEGGIFSKTYIEIDENNVLRLRSLMIPPEDLWSK